MRELLESYEDLHVDLKRDLGDEVHAETYEYYADTILRMEQWLKQSKVEIRKRKVKVLNKDRDQYSIPCSIPISQSLLKPLSNLSSAKCIKL